MSCRWYRPRITGPLQVQHRAEANQRRFPVANSQGCPSGQMDDSQSRTATETLVTGGQTDPPEVTTQSENAKVAGAARCHGVGVPGGGALCASPASLRTPCVEWVVPSPVGKDGNHPSIGSHLEPRRCHVAVLCSVAHDDEKLCGVVLDDMLAPVQWTAVEHDRAGDVAARRLHVSDDAIRLRDPESGRDDDRFRMIPKGSWCAAGSVPVRFPA